MDGLLATAAVVERSGELGGDDLAPVRPDHRAAAYRVGEQSVGRGVEREEPAGVVDDHHRVPQRGDDLVGRRRDEGQLGLAPLDPQPQHGGDEEEDRREIGRTAARAHGVEHDVPGDGDQGADQCDRVHPPLARDGVAGGPHREGGSREHQHVGVGDVHPVDRPRHE